MEKPKHSVNDIAFDRELVTNKTSVCDLDDDNIHRLAIKLVLE
ncbi:Restriction enzyme type I helicase subunit (fragment) [Vibrio nigripulchritudo SO65]